VGSRKMTTISHWGMFDVPLIVGFNSYVSAEESKKFWNMVWEHLEATNRFIRELKAAEPPVNQDK
jgi:hypothetical protein